MTGAASRHRKRSSAGKPANAMAAQQFDGEDHCQQEK
jgi:hypothetical protein